MTRNEAIEEALAYVRAAVVRQIKEDELPWPPGFDPVHGKEIKKEDA